MTEELYVHINATALLMMFRYSIEYFAYSQINMWIMLSIMGKEVVLHNIMYHIRLEYTYVY